NYLSQKKAPVDAFVSSLLGELADWKTGPWIAERFPQARPATLRRLLNLLVRLTVLERSDSAKPTTREAIRRWDTWNHAAGYFHFSTKDTEFTRSPARAFQELQRRAKSEPMPKPLRRVKALRTIPLAIPKVASAEFPAVLQARRTWRRFSNQRVSLPTLGSL